MLPWAYVVWQLHIKYILCITDAAVDVYVTSTSKSIKFKDNTSAAHQKEEFHDSRCNAAISASTTVF